MTSPARLLLHPAAKPLVFVAALLPFAWLFYGALADRLGANPAQYLDRATGIWTLRFLCITLAVTPVRVVAGLPTLQRFRRMLGLFTYFYAVLHLLCYAWFDQGFELAEIAKDIGKRPFILVGFSAFVLLTPLAATSFNRAVKALGDILGLSLPPNRIECYDISNIQGTDSVASMVVFEAGRAARNQYRRFRIKTVEGANDFESMKEVLTRRFRHGLEEQEELKAAGRDVEGSKFAKFPDLVLIDGGKIQLAFGREAMRGLGVGYIPAIGLAKRNEEIILEDREESLILPRNSAALHLLERVRDEAHRFAITYHRSLRSARTLRSRLEEVPGIGARRVRELLKAYPVPATLEEASVEELLMVQGMNRPSAEAVWKFLHEAPAGPQGSETGENPQQDPQQGMEL